MKTPPEHALRGIPAALPLTIIEAAPKVELHLHLEGAIPLDALWTLISRHGGHETVKSIDDLERRFVYTDFAHFIDTWWWMTGFLTTADDFAFVAEAVAADLARQHIVYAEASFSPTDFARHGLSPQEIGLAIRAGLDRISDVKVNLNVDLVRDPGSATAERTLDAVLEIAQQTGVRGITIGGSESAHPPEPFAGVYQKARENGLRLTAHAGEAAGPESVRGALDALQVERIGHGIRTVEDAGLLDRIVTERVPLEVCPTSNLRTGVAHSWDTHPLHTLLAAGAVVTINSDDPAMFHCSVAGDLWEAQRRWPELVDVEQLTLAAVSASWLEPPDKAKLATRVREWWAAHTAV